MKTGRLSGHLWIGAGLALIVAVFVDAADARAARNPLGVAGISARLDLTQEQSRFVPVVIHERLVQQAVLLRAKDAGLSEAELQARYEDDCDDSDSELRGVLSASQWAEWARVEEELAAQVFG